MVKQYRKGLCLDCGDEWEEDGTPIVCPECGSLDVKDGGSAYAAERRMGA